MNHPPIGLINRRKRMESIFNDCFSKLEDPRVDRTKLHLIEDIITIALCAVISGAEGWEEMEDFGNENHEWFSTFLALPNGIPSHDTISRLFSVLDNQSFQASCMDCFRRVKALIPETVIAIDGKTLCGSSRKGANLKGLHIVNAWSCANSITLGQLKVEDKSNEITAVPKVLKLLVLKGAIVTLDAMGCQEETLRDIHKAGADYIVALKGNQGDLHGAVKDSFILADNGVKELDIHKATDEINADHGRIEERKIEVINANELKAIIDPRWPELNSLVRITSRRDDSVEQRYYISSLPHDQPTKIMKAIRSHWQVENCLHWSLDISFSEDDCRIRNDNAAINFSWMRKFALSLLKRECSFKASIRRKQRKAFTNREYLTKVIQGI